MEAIRATSPWENSNQKQYRIPGGIEEISATIKDLKDAGVVVPTTSQFNSTIWSVQKTNEISIWNKYHSKSPASYPGK